MSRSTRFAALFGLLAVGLAGCEGEDDPEMFRATLSGANEVPAFNTNATGTAEFTLNENGTISYTIDVSNISGVTMGHIHGPAGPTQNAGVLVWLYPPGATAPGSPTGPVNGQLASGTFANTNVAAVSMDSLLVLMRNGQAYVNIHTTTRGAGEIRGQILPVN